MCRTSTALTTILLAYYLHYRVQDEHIAHALKVREARALGNYAAFFRLYADAPGHCAEVIETFAHGERFEALRKMVRCFMPSLPCTFIAEQLAFEDERECADWMVDHGAVLGEDGAVLDCKSSKASLVEHSISARLEEERKEAQRKAEIVPISF